MHDPKIAVTLPPMTEQQAAMVREALRHVFKKIHNHERRAEILSDTARAL